MGNGSSICVGHNLGAGADILPSIIPDLSFRNDASFDLTVNVEIENIPPQKPHAGKLGFALGTLESYNGDAIAIPMYDTV